MIRGAFALMLVLAVAAGCGGPSEAEQQAKKEAASAKAQAKKDAEQKARELAEKQARYDQCESQTSGLLTELQTLDSKLTVGMVYRDYTDEVGNAQVKYDSMVRAIKTDPKMKQDLIDSGCTQRVLLPLGKAMIKYEDASDVWTTCFKDLYCDIDNSTEGTQVNVDWRLATNLIDKATAHLNAMKP